MNDRISDAAFHDAAMIAAMQAIVTKAPYEDLPSNDPTDDFNATARGAARYATALLDARNAFTSPLKTQLRESVLVEALKQIIAMNRQQAHDQYGDADKAESWACVVTARAALAAVAEE